MEGVPGPHRDITVLNAGATLVVAGLAPTLEDGIAEATAAIDDGRAAATLDRFVEASRTAAALDAADLEA